MGRWILARAALTVALLALLGAGLVGPVAGAERVAEESRPVHGVREVALHGVGTLIIAQGRPDSLTIRAEERILPRIATDVRNGRLTIRPRASFRTTEPITYALTVEDVRAIELFGSSRLEALELPVGRLRLVVRGSGEAALGRLRADEFEVSVAGSGDVVVAGEVTGQEVEVSGSGSYRAADLASRNAAVEASGAGEAIVRVSDELTVRVSGSGRVAYLGAPRVRQEVSGGGDVEKIG